MVDLTRVLQVCKTVTIQRSVVCNYSTRTFRETFVGAVVLLLYSGQRETPLHIERINQAATKQAGIEAMLCCLHPSCYHAVLRNTRVLPTAGSVSVALVLVGRLGNRTNSVYVPCWTPVCETPRLAYRFFAALWLEAGIGRLPPSREPTSNFNFLFGCTYTKSW